MPETTATINLDKQGMAAEAVQQLSLESLTADIGKAVAQHQASAGVAGRAADEAVGQSFDARIDKLLAPLVKRFGESDRASAQSLQKSQGLADSIGKTVNAAQESVAVSAAAADEAMTAQLDKLVDEQLGPIAKRMQEYEDLQAARAKVLDNEARRLDAIRQRMIQLQAELGISREEAQKRATDEFAPMLEGVGDDPMAEARARKAKKDRDKTENQQGRAADAALEKGTDYEDELAKVQRQDAMDQQFDYIDDFGSALGFGNITGRVRKMMSAVEKAHGHVSRWWSGDKGGKAAKAKQAGNPEAGAAENAEGGEAAQTSEAAAGAEGGAAAAGGEGAALAAGGGGALAAAGPVGLVIAGAALAAKKLADTATASFDAGRALIEGSAEQAKRMASNDYMGMFEAGAEGAAKALDKIPIVGEAFGAAVRLATAPVTAFTGVVQAFVEQARNLSQYSGGIAAATATADVRSMMQDIKEANELEEPMSRLVDAESQFSSEFREMMLPIKRFVTEVLANVVEEAASELHNLHTIALVMGDFAGLIGDLEKLVMKLLSADLDGIPAALVQVGKDISAIQKRIAAADEKKDMAMITDKQMQRWLESIPG